MKIESLHIYPIKSLGGISIQSSNLFTRGLEFDRRWMLVDSMGVFISQRSMANLALFSVSLSSDHLTVRSELNNAELIIPKQPTGDKVDVVVWEDRVKAIEVSKEVSKWFSTELDQEVKLVYMADESKRLIDPKYAFNSEDVSFADGYPLLIVNTASMNDLNQKLTSKIGVSRFRPNIVVNGNIPFEEDKWSKVLIGNSQIEIVKRCARCVVINIDPSTSTRGKEVLQVLAGYRKSGNKVYFGANALIHQSGSIKVGDELLLNN